MHGLAHHRGPHTSYEYPVLRIDINVPRYVMRSHRYTLIIARRNGASFRSLTGVADCVSLEARHANGTAYVVEYLAVRTANGAAIWLCHNYLPVA